jgi:ATP-dependent RNA helicase RhlE
MHQHPISAVHTTTAIQDKHNQTFQGLCIAPVFLEILTRTMGYSSPTPIQKRCIPLAIQGKDVVGIAQTGTGKTLAYGLPVLQNLRAKNGSKALVLVPTRELALQVDAALRPIAAQAGVRAAVLIGGEAIERQKCQLDRQPALVIATPGRLIDHLEHESLVLASTRILVLDEADRMLDMGFAPQINTILRYVPGERQTMLFSATMPEEIVKVASRHMKLPVRVEIAPAGTTVREVSQKMFFVEQIGKLDLLQKLLFEHGGSALVFTRTKVRAKRLSRALRAAGHRSIELHSDRSLPQRRDALEGFRAGRYRVLVATDVAARGLDVIGIELVVNYDLPATAEDYVHRIGRTARAGAVGHAITFAMPDQRHEVQDIERLIRATIRVSPVPDDLLRLPARAIAKPPRARSAGSVSRIGR